MKKQIILLIASVASCLAAEIVSVGPATGPITLSCSPNPCINYGPVQGNGPTPVWSTPDVFSFDLTVNGVGAYTDPIIVTLPVKVTEYDVTVTVTNNTSLPIIGWTFGLPGVPYDFDYPNYDGPDTDTLAWGVTRHTDGILEFEAGAGTPLTPGATMSFTMAIDFPLCSSPLPACDFTGDPQFGPGAQLPEPGTITMLAAPLLALLIYIGRKMFRH